MSFLVEFHAADVHLGGKARSVAMLAEQGLETPPGFAISDALFRTLCPAVPEFQHLDQAALDALDGLRGELMRTAWPAGFRDELHARLGAIGVASYAVRSSFASEDLPGQLAPGVYESCGNVPLHDVERAIRQVLCSALAPGAVAYAMAHGEKPAKAPVAVLVHAFVKGDAEGSAAFAPERMEEPLISLRRGQLTVETKAALGRSLAVLAGVRGPTEIEWVFAEGRVVYLQARPFEPPAPPAPWTGFDDLPGGAATRTLWRWDASHNPCRSRQPRPGWSSSWMKGVLSVFASVCSVATSSIVGIIARSRLPSRQMKPTPSSPPSALKSRHVSVGSAYRLIWKRLSRCFSLPTNPFSECYSRPCANPAQTYVSFSKAMPQPRLRCFPRSFPACHPWPASGANWQPVSYRSQARQRAPAPTTSPASAMKRRCGTYVQRPMPSSPMPFCPIPSGARANTLRTIGRKQARRWKPCLPQACMTDGENLWVRLAQPWPSEKPTTGSTRALKPQFAALCLLSASVCTTRLAYARSRTSSFCHCPLFAGLRTMVKNRATLRR
jgi:hypothetical protein